MATETQGVHSFTVTDIDGREVALSDYAGKVLLVVNTASKCGFTKQYAGLEKLHREYKDRGFEVLGFPSNDFGGQEPGTEAEIKKFCSLKFDVTFPMFSKIKVTGGDIHPLYAYMTEEAGDKIAWNFNKFLIGREGQVIAKYGSRTEPFDTKLVAKLEELLAA
ncbi:MAG: glutathione peroxidase [Candidatus Omnitrophota bacterium]|nr:glutathione peroxidase [Candidatus Omnitrophota bacterium]